MKYDRRRRPKATTCLVRPAKAKNGLVLPDRDQATKAAYDALHEKPEVYRVTENYQRIHHNINLFIFSALITPLVFLCLDTSMGQDFKITNVDKRHSLQENGYKFCEILGDSLAERLVDLLQVPQLRIYKLDKVAIAAARSRR